ncbi:RnfABCDGE type electron transport complex subunit D [Anaerovorax odorimutans]|uniref:RnfABCDGE type electron transport complex subunit D n=1 Tax=Anaerovorax odorimutans TaxID=109327 RepID=UPI0004166624|nr:RnfABCDGE type electron transport complex subunit D [Anaerovorax odorimutans]
MKNYKYDNLIVASSPHLVDSITTSKIMAMVIIALMPAFAVSIWVFGARAIFLTGICIIACVVFEYLFNKITKKPSTIGDFSAVVTGILVAFNVPVNFPYWMAIIGCFVAIIIAKQLFGGIGQNFVNPAITARVVLFLAFSTEMTSWPTPQRIFLATDAVTGATPLALFAKQNFDQLPSNTEMFLGTIGGCIGETSALALLIGGLFLLFKKIISPTIPVSFLGTMVVISLIAGIDPIFQICAGGAMIGAFFMATDYSTSPLTTNGKIIFGIGCGLITMVIRLFGNYPEGVSFSILFMNLIVPHIDNLSRRKLYGGGVKND